MKTAKLNYGKIVCTIIAAIIITVGVATSVAAQEIADSEIAEAVDDQLIADGAMPADGIDVAVNDGIVTLTGDVDNILAKERAERLATIVKGVRGVVNDIVVMPRYRPDDEIEQAIEDALERDPVADPSDVRLTVKNGAAILSGTVDSWEMTQLIERVAKGVRGVTDITNNLENEFATDRSDSEIKSEIMKSIRWDAYLDGSLITVNVEDGHVELEGVVGSAAEKDRAYRRAWVPGVKNVDIDMEDLEVKHWARDEELRKMKYNSITDAEIEQAVIDALEDAPRVSPVDIEVDVDDGEVTLRGDVDNLHAKRLAGRHARAIVGVWRVNNRIKIAGEAPSDRRLELDIRTSIAENPYLESFEIDVSVDDGIVYLLGMVDTAFEKAQAGELAGNHIGVKSVKNHIDIGTATSSIYSPYVGWPYDPIDVQSKIDSRADFDAAIESDIESEIFWSPFVSNDDVEVDVEGGVATLTGSVGTWTEYNAAEDNAYQGGAVDVVNEIVFEFGPNKKYGPY